MLFSAAWVNLIAAQIHKNGPYCFKSFVRYSSARGSLDCPSQKIACLRTIGSLLESATAINWAAASSLGKRESAKTADFRICSLGSLVAIVRRSSVTLLPPLFAIQNCACLRTCGEESS